MENKFSNRSEQNIGSWVVGKLAKAFTAMRTFMMVTMIPAITAMMGPFLIPLALIL